MSYYRKHQKEMFGGSEWANIILAIGTIDVDNVDIVNDEIQRRVHIKTGRPMEKRIDRADQTVRGVQHSLSYAKKLREAASALDNNIAKQAVLLPEWSDAHEVVALAIASTKKRDAAWNEAEQASYQAGHAFKDRHGTWQCTDPKDVVGISLRQWCRRKNIMYS